MLSKEPSPIAGESEIIKMVLLHINGGTRMGNHKVDIVLKFQVHFVIS